MLTLLSNIQLTNQTMTIRLDRAAAAVRTVTSTRFLTTERPLALLANLKNFKCLTDKDFQLKQQP